MTSNIAVIVPVYRDLSASKRCLQSLLNTIDLATTDVLVVNDASPEPELTEYCRAICADSGFRLIEHATNLGFVSSVNEGMDELSDSDVIILNSDTQVPAGWLDRICAVASAHPNAASITPFSNNATICSYPDFCSDNPLVPGHDVNSLDKLVWSANSGEVVELPTGVGFCMYLRRSALDQIGDFDEAAFGRGYGEENDWCLRASEAGWRHLLCGDLFVFHAGGASFGKDAQSLQASAMAVLESRYPDYNKRVAEFVERDPIEPLRFAIDQARTTTGEGQAVLAESRSRERAAKAEWYQLDKARHEQATRAHELLAEARAQTQSVETALQGELDKQVAAAKEQEVAYSQQLQSLQGHSKEQTRQYQQLEGQHQQLEGHYQQLEGHYQQLEGHYQQLEGQYLHLDNKYGDLQTHQAQLEEKIARIESLWFVRLYRLITGRWGQS